MKPVDPIDVVNLFVEERDHLLQLLSALSDDQWATPTICPGWTVKDVALHVLGVDIGVLSRGRNGFHDPPTIAPGETPLQWTELAALVNQLNAVWVEATRRISPRLLCELLAVTGAALAAYVRDLDPTAIGEPVSWAGPAPAPVWREINRLRTRCWRRFQSSHEARRSARG